LSRAPGGLEECFSQALKIAQAQGARLLELRAAVQREPSHWMHSQAQGSVICNISVPHTRSLVFRFPPVVCRHLLDIRRAKGKSPGPATGASFPGGCMVRGQGGWHPPSSASTNLTQAVSGRSSGSRIFPPPATNPARIRRVILRCARRRCGCETTTPHHRHRGSQSRDRHLRTSRWIAAGTGTAQRPQAGWPLSPPRRAV